jgi:hypothetical protein
MLIVAIDHLPLSSVLCSSSNSENNGIDMLCRESIRFTHAYTTSTLTTPALASIMTGLYPKEHLLRHNGQPGLDPQFVTLAEKFVVNRRTALFSSGAPLLKRSGLHQGFEDFDDEISEKNKTFNRSFQDTNERFFKWLENEVNHEPFFAVIYSSDLRQLFNTSAGLSETESGAPRALTIEGQLDEFNDQLASLMSELKKKSRWDDTHFILVGLQGRASGNHVSEINPLNLKSDNTKVALFIKPAAKPRDLGLSWTIDRQVSLADLGRSLMELSGTTWKTNTHAISFAPLFTNQKMTWQAEPQKIFVESGWGFWHGYGPVRTALITEKSLVIDDEHPKAYSTHIDRSESSPLVLTDEIKQRLSDLENWGSVPWPDIKEDEIFKILPQVWFEPHEQLWSKKILSSLALNKKTSLRSLRWIAQASLDQKNWSKLKQAADFANNKNWQAVALRNLNLNSLDKNSFAHPCLEMFFDGNKAPSRDCRYEPLISLFEYSKASAAEAQYENKKKKFLIAYEQVQSELMTYKINAAAKLTLLPVQVENNIPSLLHLALATPELKKYRP